jgi:putative transposase
MKTAVQRLFEVLAGARHADLRRQVQFLRAENQILLSRLKAPVRTTPAERARLVRLGRPLGPAAKHLLTIVAPNTFNQWIHRARVKRRKKKPAHTGRPRTKEDIRALIVRMGKETQWGCVRIQGELRKLRIYSVSSTTVRAILKEHGIPPAPARGEGTWDQFIRAHAKTLWACDFVSKKVWTRNGLVNCFALVFIHIASRRVRISPCTTNPGTAWVAQQARDFAGAARAVGDTPRQLIRDGDSKFGEAFEGALRRLRIEPVRTAYHAPAMNAYAGRFIGTLKRECLDRFIVLGTRHFDYLVRVFAQHYDSERPHAAIGNRPPAGPSPPRQPVPPGPVRVICDERLGRVIRHYRRKAG